MRRKRPEFSKTILKAVAIARLLLSYCLSSSCLRLEDTSALAYIVPGIFTELSAATGFYFWKAKAENQIKLDIVRQKKLKDQKHPDDDPEESEADYDNRTD